MVAVVVVVVLVVDPLLCLLVAGRWPLLAADSWSSGSWSAGCWSSGSWSAGFWSLIAGCWLLVAGCWRTTGRRSLVLGLGEGKGGAERTA